MADAAMKHMASNFAKLDKFEVVDFRRWQKKMHFLLTTLISEDDGNDATNVESYKELWDSLEAKYMAEDASSKKFLDDDIAWWVESGATVHVCKDRCWFKTYESLNDGSILYMGNESKALVHGRSCVDLRFSMTDMGEADVILGIRIKHESNGIAISQSHYIKKVLKKFNYFDCTTMYAMTYTRPDIAFSVGKLSRYTSNPVLEGYTNAIWINNTEDNSSTSGWGLARDLVIKSAKAMCLQVPLESLNVVQLRHKLDEVQMELDKDHSCITLREEEVVYLTAFTQATLDEERLSTDKAANMVRCVSDDEIQSAMFSIGNDKVSGPDGYTSVFFKKSCDVVGMDICNAVKDFFSTALDESVSSRNHVRKFLRASKVLKKDSEVSKNKKEKYKSMALKAKKVSSDEEVLCSDSDDEEYAMVSFRRAKEEKKGKEERRCFKCGNPDHFISECPKHSFNNQKAFVGGCWNDSEEEDDSKKDEICLMALDNNEVLSNTPYYSISSLDSESLQNEYNKLCKISLRIINKNKHLKTKNEILDNEVCDLKKRLERLEKNKEISVECESYKKNGPRFKEDKASTSEVKTGKSWSRSGKMPSVELIVPVPSAKEPASADVGYRGSAENYSTLDSNSIKKAGFV
ncbi:zf-CCHC domain-containing protein [Tanacetum coccineum]